MARKSIKPTFSLGLFIGVILAVAAFIAGVYMSADIISAGSKMVIGTTDFAENAPANPFGLRIIRHKNKDNKYEVFLFDPEQNDAVRRISKNLTVEVVTAEGYSTESLITKPEQDAGEVVNLIKRRTETEAAKRKLLHTDSVNADEGKEGEPAAEGEAGKTGDDAAKKEPAPAEKKTETPATAPAPPAK
ncbi:MAG TPA: hypothetical protein PL033_13820 [Candidatus Brocadiia bacterium]|nr:hypothetical protein [Candidatus Brocadiia bacterium]